MVFVLPKILYQKSAHEYVHVSVHMCMYILFWLRSLGTLIPALRKNQEIITT